MEAEEEGYLRFILTKVTETISHIEDLYKMNESIIALAGLYGDVYFIYNEGEDHLNVYNAGNSSFRSGEYTIAEFEEELIDRGPEGTAEIVRGLFTTVYEGARSVTRVVPGNLIDDNPKSEETLIRLVKLTHHEGSVSIAGSFHAFRARSTENEEVVRRDGLTGLVSKTQMQEIAREFCNAKDGRKFTLGIIDIDFFKNINDTYGHMEGDKVLQRIGAVVSSEIGTTGIAGRIGGDEFMVLINTDVEADLRKILSNIKNLVRTSFPGKGPNGADLTLSIGCASFPRDCDSYENLFLLADHCLYLAKKKGRNRYIIYKPAKHGTLDEIMKEGVVEMLDQRSAANPAEMLVNLYYKTVHGTAPGIQQMLDEFCLNMEVPNLYLLKGKDLKIRYYAGTYENKKETLATMESLLRENDQLLGDSDFLVINTIEHMPQTVSGMVAVLRKLGFLSMIIVKFNDVDGEPCELVLTSTGTRRTWNEYHFKYLHTFIDLLKNRQI